MATPKINLGFGKKPAEKQDLAVLYARDQGRDIEVPPDEIDPNPHQPRHEFDPAGIEELAESIRQYGFLGVLHAREVDGRYQLAFGERRLRASRVAGVPRLPLRIHAYTDDQMLEIALVENLQRRDLRPLEEAEAFRIMQERGLSIRDIAVRIGKDKGYVENRLALLRAPQDVRDMVAEKPNTVAAAREIARLPEPEQRAPLIERVRAGEASSREVRAEVSRVVPPRPQVTPPSRRTSTPVPATPVPAVPAPATLAPATPVPPAGSATPALAAPAPAVAAPAEQQRPVEAAPAAESDTPGVRRVRDEAVRRVQEAAERAQDVLSGLGNFDWTNVDDERRDRSVRVLDQLIAYIEDLQFKVAPRRRPRLVAGPATRRFESSRQR